MGQATIWALTTYTSQTQSNAPMNEATAGSGDEERPGITGRGGGVDVDAFFAEDAEVGLDGSGELVDASLARPAVGWAVTTTKCVPLNTAEEALHESIKDKNSDS